MMSLILFMAGNTYSIEVQCKFEEVYPDGSIQQGFFFYQEGSMRYQYQSNQLYTLIYNQEQLYLIQNFNTSAYQIIYDKKNIIDLLSIVSEDFPNINNQYEINEQIFILEMSSTSNFIKRLSVISNSLNMSLYFNDCETDNLIPQKLFSVRPFVDQNSL